MVSGTVDIQARNISQCLGQLRPSPCQLDLNQRSRTSTLLAQPNYSRRRLGGEVERHRVQVARRRRIQRFRLADRVDRAPADVDKDVYSIESLSSHVCGIQGSQPGCHWLPQWPGNLNLLESSRCLFKFQFPPDHIPKMVTQLSCSSQLSTTTMAMIRSTHRI